MESLDWGRWVMVKLRSRHKKAALAILKKEPVSLCVVWNLDETTYLAFALPGNSKSASICKFPSDSECRAFIRRLGVTLITRLNHAPIADDLVRQLHFPACAQADLRLGIEVINTTLAKPLTSITAVAILWSDLPIEDAPLRFMLALGTKAHGLLETKSFASAGARDAYLDSLAQPLTRISANENRDFTSQDLDLRIRSTRKMVADATKSESQVRSVNPRLAQRGSPSRGQTSRRRLTGNALVERVKQLEGRSKAEILSECGYTSTRSSDGMQTRDFAGFYASLSEARTVVGDSSAKTHPTRSSRWRRRTNLPIVIPAGLTADDLARPPKSGRRLTPAAVARREALYYALKEEEERRTERRRRREESLANRRRRLGLDEPEAPEDMMRIAIRAGAPGSKR
jgi:hypothetical protein